MIRSFRFLLLLALLGSAGLPLYLILTDGELTASAGTGVLWWSLLGLATLAGSHGLLRRLEPHMLSESGRQVKVLEAIPNSLLPLAIASAAALSLLLELAVIRWQATVFEFFALYKNYGLLACFVGLGLGYAMAGSAQGIPLSLTLPLLAWQFGFLVCLRFGLKAGSLETIPFREQLSMGLRAGTGLQIAAVYWLLAVVFLLTALAFLPVGQLCGRLMERRSQLSAYGLNLLGSLVGVCVMFAVSSLWTPPVVWFGLCFLPLLLFLPRTGGSLVVGLGSATLATAILAWPVNPPWNRLYSPYQLLELGYGENGLLFVRAAGHYHQRVHNLAASALQGTTDARLLHVRAYYDLPYLLHGRPGRVAVVGAGTGNDVAAALRAGAEHVDAIEIDPAILLAGKTDHPERPYDDPRVRAVVNDARSFFRNTTEKYDLIVYGLLDSHTLLSQASSVRLDSFVYTVEALREARSRLTDSGVLSLSFSVMNDLIGLKIYRMMREAFDGREPVCVLSGYDGSQIFLESNHGRLPASSTAPQEFTFGDFYRDAGPTTSVDLSTDDWPFLYMPRRIYPLSYLLMLALVLALSAGLIASFSEERLQIAHTPFFFLGAGFMLVETKAITELGLVFGNTWLVIAVAVGSILVMAFLANAMVARLETAQPLVPYLLVLASLAAGWWVSREGGFASTPLGRVETTAILTCPLFFSGIVFSTLISAERRISSVMAMNLLGATCGGILEYNSMYFGFRALYVLAIGLYAAALASGFALRNSAPRGTPLPQAPGPPGGEAAG